MLGTKSKLMVTGGMWMQLGVLVTNIHIVLVGNQTLF